MDARLQDTTDSVDLDTSQGFSEDDLSDDLSEDDQDSEGREVHFSPRGDFSSLRIESLLPRTTTRAGRIPSA